MGESGVGRRSHRRDGAVVACLAVLLVLLLPGCASLRRSLGGDATLYGYVEVRLVAASDIPDSTQLAEARSVIAKRLKTAGMSGVKVSKDGETGALVTVEGSADKSMQEDRLRRLVAPGNLRIRAVLNQTADTAVVSASSSPVLASASAVSSTEEALSAVITKLGEAYPLAEQVPDTVQPSALDESYRQALAPFGLLTPEEVALLPAAIQFKVPTISCQQLLARPVDAIADVSQPVVACGEVNNEYVKYSLDAAAVVGDDIEDVSAAEDSADGGWTVTLAFTDDGQIRWTELTEQAYADGQRNPVAFVLDTQVITAPTIESVIMGAAILSGGFTKADAKELVAEVEYGTLPVIFTVSSVKHTT